MKTRVVRTLLWGWSVFALGLFLALLILVACTKTVLADCPPNHLCSTPVYVDGWLAPYITPAQGVVVGGGQPIHVIVINVPGDGR